MKSESINELAAALSKAQGEMPDAVLDCKNPHYKSMYASLKSVTTACRASLSKHGLSVTQGVVKADDTTIYLETILMHSSGQFTGFKCPLVLDKQNMQGLGSAITYAKRYSLAALVGVVDSEDDDGNAASGTVADSPKPAGRKTSHSAAYNEPPRDPEDYEMQSAKGKILRELSVEDLNNVHARLEGYIKVQTNAGNTVMSMYHEDLKALETVLQGRIPF